MARLVVKDGVNKGMSFEVRGAHFSIGRDLSNDIQLLFPKVSRVHAELSMENGTYFIEDKASRNGTFVNGAEVTRSPLNDRDSIGIGDTLFTFFDIRRPKSNTSGKRYGYTKKKNCSNSFGNTHDPLTCVPCS